VPPTIYVVACRPDKEKKLLAFLWSTLDDLSEIQYVSDDDWSRTIS